MIKVYLAINPKFERFQTTCKERNEELLTIKNQKVFNEKLRVWLLLEYALKDCGFYPEQLNFKKLPSGKWTATGVEFSLSHSADLFAVAICNEPVGVDAQKHTSVNYSRLAQKILSENELYDFAQVDEKDKNASVIRKWTEKESIFKAYEKGDVTYKNLASLNYFTASEDLVFANGTYTLAVSCKTSKKVEIIVADKVD